MLKILRVPCNLRQYKQIFQIFMLFFFFHRIVCIKAIEKTVDKYLNKQKIWILLQMVARGIRNFEWE